MRSQAQQPTAQLGFKPIHDRNDSDQRRDTDANAQHRDPADERDEESATATAHIAQTDEQKERMKHASLDELWTRADDDAAGSASKQGETGSQIW
jgi:hypothetical protein